MHAHVAGGLEHGNSGSPTHTNMKTFTLAVIVAKFCFVNTLGVDVHGEDRNNPSNDFNTDGDIVDVYNAMHFRQFYCRTGFHLQIFPNGSIGGTPEDHNRFGILKLISLQQPNTVAIKGVDSGLFLAMNRYGQLYTSPILNRNCMFIEEVMDIIYTRYASARHPTKRKRGPGTRNEKSSNEFWYVALGNSGEPMNSVLTKPEYKRVQFLARAVDPEKVPYLYNFPVVEQLEEIQSKGHGSP